jgi:site-specific recombinase XerD
VHARYEQHSNTRKAGYPILGHASISTTQLYLRSMGLEHLQEGHAKYSPLGRLA